MLSHFLCFLRGMELITTTLLGYAAVIQEEGKDLTRAVQNIYTCHLPMFQIRSITSVYWRTVEFLNDLFTYPAASTSHATKHCRLHVIYSDQYFRLNLSALHSQTPQEVAVVVCIVMSICKKAVGVCPLPCQSTAFPTEAYSIWKRVLSYPAINERIGG
jgi:hypothetical protein